MNVRVPCDDCGDVSIRMPDLHVRFCLDDCATSYWFICPECSKRVVSDVHETKRVVLLTHPGITPECWSLPLELTEVHEGPPISEVDIERFLEETKWTAA